METILQIFHNIENSKILITTPSNSGANLICEILLRHHNFGQTDLVRLHSYNASLKGKDNISNAIAKHSALLDTTYPGVVRDEFSDDESAESSIDRVCFLSDVQNFRIVITTCAMMGCMQSRPDAAVAYSHVFIDEAGQCTEPQALIPIDFLDRSNGQIVLAGDPKQLGPVVFSLSAKQYSLGKSLLSRIIELPIYEEKYDVRIMLYDIFCFISAHGNNYFYI